MASKVKCKSCGHTTQIKNPWVFGPSDYEFGFDPTTQSVVLREGRGVQISVDCKGCGTRVLDGFVELSIPDPAVVWKEKA